VAQDFCGFETSGARFVVQGFGAVGKHAARFLGQAGAVAVAVSDSAGTIYNPDGLDLEALIELKSAGKSVTEYAHGEKRDGDAIIDIECDIWIPAARPDVIHEGNVDRLKTRLIVQGANIPVTYAAEKTLHEKGILNIPDFIANAGGVICAAVEYQGAGETAALETIEEKLRRNTREVLETAQRERIMPRDAALEIARKRVQQAMNYRRWHIF
jgi:glutamate dehydrogenase (NAD(P)+)